MDIHQERHIRFDLLLPNQREWLGSSQSFEFLKQIKDHFSLTDDQRLEIARLSLDSCLNLVSTNELPTLIAERLKIPPAWAVPVANELEDGLIKAFRALGNAPIIAAETGRVSPEVRSPTTSPVPQTTPAWTHVEEPAVPEIREPEVMDEQPFYPRVPNYSKPMTNPGPRPPHTPRANDPYHEPIG